MDRPCCVGVIRDSSKLVGSEVTLGKTMKAYYAAPKQVSGKRMGILVIHDIFGFALPNCKYVADHFAARGYDAIMPDFYTGKDDVNPSAWPATETEITKPLEGDDFGKWFGSITSDGFWDKFKSEVDDATAFLRRKGCIRFGVVGFCWGGIAAERAAMNGRFIAAASVHGCMHTAETYKQVKGNIIYLSVPGDPFFGKEGQDSIIAAGGKVKNFEGMGHGFAVRGDYSNEKVKQAADECIGDVEKLFSDSCLRKPKYTKLGSLSPASTGVNALVKILSEPKEVAEDSKKSGSAKFYEVTCGDETAQAIMSLKDSQLEGISKDKVICVRNAGVKMIKSHIRIVVDKWGKLDKEVTGSIDEIGEKNVSNIEYELVDH